jgi:hypothetical protein
MAATGNSCFSWSISKYLLLWNYFAKMNRNLVGSGLKLLKAEWKVSDTIADRKRTITGENRRLPAFSDVRGPLLRGHLSYKATFLFTITNWFDKVNPEVKKWRYSITSILLIFFSWEQKNCPWAGGWENVNTIISSRVDGSTDFCCSSLGVMSENLMSKDSVREWGEVLWVYG